MDTSEINLIKRIHQHFKNSGSTLCVAESCTGGLISHLLTGLPGASEFLDSSVVCYSTDSKRGLLGISRALIKSCGVISEEAARAIAIAVRKKRKTDFSVAVTGNLGPAGMEGKKAGLVYMAVDSKKGTVSKGMVFKGNRESVKHKAAVSSMQLLCGAFEKWV